MSANINNILLFTAILLAFIHFAIPLAYYLYLKRKWLNKPWNIKRDPGYRPRVAVIVPAYNEVELVESKLNE